MLIPSWELANDATSKKLEGEKEKEKEKTGWNF
jgi:hypothetical protein